MGGLCGRRVPAGEHQHSDPDGRSFFVLDVKTGATLWEYYYKDNISERR